MWENSYQTFFDVLQGFLEDLGSLAIFPLRRKIASKCDSFCDFSRKKSPDLPPLASLDLLAFFLLKEFLAFFSVFSGIFLRDFRGSLRIRILASLVVCRFPKNKERKIREASPLRFAGDGDVSDRKSRRFAIATFGALRSAGMDLSVSCCLV